MAFSDERKMDINRDLDSYLSSRSKFKPSSFFKRKNRKATPKFNDSVEIIEDNRTSFVGSFKSFLAKMFASKEKGPEDIPMEQLEPQEEALTHEPDVSYELDAQEEDETEKIGLFSRIFIKLGLAKVENYEDDLPVVSEVKESDEIIVSKQDMKDIVKATTQILKGLNQEQVNALKNSDEFAKYKDILRKYNLIK